MPIADQLAILVDRRQLVLDDGQEFPGVLILLIALIDWQRRAEIEQQRAGAGSQQSPRNRVLIEQDAIVCLTWLRSASGSEAGQDQRIWR